MRYIFAALVISSLAVLSIIALLWLIMQVVHMAPIIIFLVLVAVVTVYSEEKRFNAEWRRDMGYDQEDI